MQRIRTVKPELFRHEDLFEAEKMSKLSLRLAFIGLFTCCDREGRFRWRPKQLKLDILPYDADVDMDRVLDALLTRGFIVKYVCKGEVYGCIPSWHKHQYVNNRESASALPGFDEDGSTLEIHKNDASTTCEAQVEDATEKHSCILTGKGNGNIKGKEREKEREMERIARDAQLTCRSRELDALIVIFDHWKSATGLSHAVLDNKRRDIIRNALSMGYSIEQLCNAIDGCRNTPHNMGKNDQGQRYDGLHIIFRDADQIDRFIRNFYQPPQSVKILEKRTQHTVQNLQNWLDKKSKQEEILDHEVVEVKDENQ